MSDLSGSLSGGQAISGSLSGGSTLQGGLSMGGVSPTELLNKADVITDTASGSIVSIPDGMASPVLGLSVDIDPIQDLHGYDNPWPAGGGKNLLNYSLASTSTTSTNFNYGIKLVANQAYTFSYYGSDNVNIICYLHGTSTRLFTSGYTKVYTYVPEEDANVDITYYNSPSIVSAGNLFQLEKGSTSTPFAPYSNICPISGRSEVKVVNAKRYVYLRPDAPESVTANGVTWKHTNYPFVTAKGKASGGTAYSGTIGGRNQDNTLTAGTHVLKIIGSYQNVNLVVGIGSDPVRILNTSTPEMTITLTENKAMNWYCTVSNGNTVDAEFAFVIGDYQMITVQLGQTVYGGTVDVTEGKLTISHQSKQMTGASSEGWNLWDGKFVAYISGIAKYNATSSKKVIIADRFKSAGVNYRSSCGDGEIIKVISNNIYIACYSSAYENINSFTASLAINPMTVCYELDTPVEVTLTAEELDILYGDNNVWADSGDTTVEYRADTKKYILKKIAEALNA